MTGVDERVADAQGARLGAAVLLVDLDTHEVIHANADALALTPGAALPLPVDAWEQAAGLRSRDGAAPGDGRSPLARVAQGDQVAGELVALRPAAVTRAATHDGAGSAGAGSGGAGSGGAGPDRGAARLLWATGVPLASVPGLSTHALVVLLDLSAETAGRAAGSESLHALRDRAVVATDISFTVSDPNQPDNPLVWVNPAFERVTGWTAAEAIGRNCRFLQGPGTAEGHVELLRTAQRERRATTVTLLNYHRDGTPFWNEVALSPVFDGDGSLTHFVGVQADVTARVHAEQERERALAAEREARAEAERAQARLHLLAQATAVLSLDVDTAMQNLASLTVPALADWCSVELVQDASSGYRLAVAHREAGGADLLRQADRIRPRHLVPAAAAAVVLAGGEPLLIEQVDDDYLQRVAVNDEQLAIYRRLETCSAMVLPLRARRQTLGTITLATTAASGRRLTADDLELAKDLTRRAALAVDNARLYTREHQVAEALQRSLLPTLPAIPGLAVAARYLASSEGSQVGGDWYDVLALPDGAVGVAIGDVMGHDISAAASMGQLRSVLRSYAWEGGRASDVLDRLDQLVQALEMAQLATAVYGRLERAPGGELWTLRYANAGHLPPLLRRPDGSAVYLDGGRSVLLGAPVGERRGEASETLPLGSSLLLFTDGLVERRDRALDEGLERLRTRVEASPAGADPEALCDAVLADAGDGLEDDVAILALRLDRPPTP